MLWGLGSGLLLLAAVAAVVWMSWNALGAAAWVPILVAAALALCAWILFLRLYIRRCAHRLAAPVESLLSAAQDLAAGRLKEDMTASGAEEYLQFARIFNRLRTLLAMAEVKFRTLFANTSTNILLLEPDTHLIVDANRALEQLVWRKRRDLIGQPFLSLFDAAQHEALAQGLHQAEQAGQAQVEGMLCTLGGQAAVYLDISMNLIQVRTERILEVSFKDVTDASIKKQELVEIAYTDDLTGLFNQRAFHERAPILVRQAAEAQARLCMLFLDLDNFKRCNDTHGHQVGDDLLRRVGRIINDNIRNDRDMGFRYGGDEFAVLLPRASAEVGERIAETVAQQYTAEESHGTTMSIGIAMLQPGTDFAAFVRKADEALYAAKSAGKNSIHLADSA